MIINNNESNQQQLSNDNNIGTFVWFSDIHFDPFYGSSSTQYKGKCTANANYHGTVGCDSPLTLLQDAISNAKAVVPLPDFVLLSGDSCRHMNDLFIKQLDNPLETMTNAIKRVSIEMRKGFPSPIPILPALGNNDVMPDYTIDIEDSNNTLLTTIVSGAFLDIMTPAMAETFQRGGYYYFELSSYSGVGILVLNTIIYSVKHRPNQTYINDPYQQFQWMESQLQTARKKNQKIYVMGHIPPTVGSYRHSQFWHTQYLLKYLTLIDTYSDIVVAQLFGHLHSNEFRVLPSKQSKSDNLLLPPLFITSALTPIYGNNPSFRIVTYNTQDFTILDYETFYINVQQSNQTTTTAQWQKLSTFRQSFHVSDLSTVNLLKVANSITTTDEIASTFQLRLYSNNAANKNNTCDNKCRTI